MHAYHDFIHILHALTSIRYQPDLLAETCKAFGWDVATPDWNEPDQGVALEVRAPFWPAPLVALFGAEQMAALFLFALVGKGDEDPYSGVSWEWFDGKFDEAQFEISQVLSLPARTGKYAGHSGRSFRYAIWDGQISDLVLLQHFEGDGHYGHLATIDIRIIPHRAEQLHFPLQTSLIL